MALNRVRLYSRSTRVFQSRLPRMLLISLGKSLQQGSLSTLERVMICNVHWVKAVRKVFLRVRQSHANGGPPCGEYSGIGMVLKCTFAYS